MPFCLWQKFMDKRAENLTGEWGDGIDNKNLISFFSKGFLVLY